MNDEQSLALHGLCSGSAPCMPHQSIPLCAPIICLGQVCEQKDRAGVLHEEVIDGLAECGLSSRDGVVC